MAMLTGWSNGHRMGKAFYLPLFVKVEKPGSISSLPFLLSGGPLQNYPWLMLNMVPIHLMEHRWPLHFVRRQEETGSVTGADGKRIFIFSILKRSDQKIFRDRKPPVMNFRCGRATTFIFYLIAGPISE